MTGRWAPSTTLLTAWIGFIAVTVPFDVGGKPAAIVATVAEHPTAAAVWATGEIVVAVAFLATGLALAARRGRTGRQRGSAALLTAACLLGLGALGAVSEAALVLLLRGGLSAGIDRAHLAAGVAAAPAASLLAMLLAVATIAGVTALLVALRRMRTVPLWLPIAYPLVAIAGTALLPWDVLIVLLTVAVTWAAYALSTEGTRHATSTDDLLADA